MGTGIKRYYYPLDISEIKKLIGQEIDCVSLDGAVIRGAILDVNADYLLVKNGVKNKIKLQLSTLAELTLAC